MVFPEELQELKASKRVDGEPAQCSLVESLHFKCSTMLTSPRSAGDLRTCHVHTGWVLRFQGWHMLGGAPSLDSGSLPRCSYLGLVPCPEAMAPLGIYSLLRVPFPRQSSGQYSNGENTVFPLKSACCHFLLFLFWHFEWCQYLSFSSLLLRSDQLAIYHSHRDHGKYEY